jgi:hypothetical protein
VQRASRNLDGSSSVVACVVGFPLGAVDTTVKVVYVLLCFAQNNYVYLLVHSSHRPNLALYYSYAVS